MKKCPNPYVLEDNRLKHWFTIAQRNWDDLRDIFEHHGDITDNPVLACPAKFASFLSGYFVGRTIQKRRHDEFRLALRESLPKAVKDGSGKEFDKLENDLHRSFGGKSGKKGRNHIISALSKVAAFVRPKRFVAWDQFAKKGVNILLCNGVSSPFKKYSDYLVAVNRVWKGEPGKQIRDYAAKNYRANPLMQETRFLRRVLDVYLMDCGGRRWSNSGKSKKRARSMVE